MTKTATDKARAKVFSYAKAKGHVTSAKASKLLGTKQGHYHLNEMAKLGYLKRASWNRWEPTRRRSYEHRA